MNSYRLSERSIPLDDSWDVIVAGGGPAGCTAAAAAAREGARTLLIEATGALGGMGTSGLVPAWCPFTDGEKIIYAGMAEKVLKECMAGMPHVPPDRFDWTPIDPERLKRVYDSLVSEHGATVLFNSFLAGVDSRRAGTVDAILVANKAGLTAFKARTYVDCTGDADLAAWAGAEWKKGDEHGTMMPATPCFVLANVNEDAYRRGPRLHAGNEASPAWKIADDPAFPLVQDSHLCDNLVGPGTVGFNAGHLYDVDGTEPRSCSQAMMTGRKLVAQLRDGLAKHAPEAFGNAFLVSTAPLMGIRETRRIIGDYVLTFDDWLARRSFADEICRNCYFIDIHAAKAELEKQKATRTELAVHRFEHYRKGESHGIPYRCLTPKGLTNVLVAGRSISTDRTVQGSTRVMPVCLCMGEAAGVAAALATTGSADVHAVDTRDLRARLTRHGAYLPGTDRTPAA